MTRRRNYFRSDSAMKKTIALAAVLAVASLAFCSVVKGPLSDVRVATTEHFDIIYEQKSLETASLIYDNCEDVYSSLVQYFGVDPKFHTSVVVTSKYKDLNASYNSYPANRIFIFDTVTDLGQQASHRQVIVDIFRHELTHAFHQNIRGPFFDSLSKIFGDPVSFSPLFFLYPSLAEGGAILSESADGYGRLNSSYSMQIVKQAKLEGLFPNWFEIAGARDTYPSGLLYYNFAAAFLEYLEITYGHEVVASVYRAFAYPRFWPTPGNVIQEHIGIPISQAWQNFYNWVEVPSDVIEAEVVPSRTQSAMYWTFRLSPDGSVYVYDSSSWRVVRFSPDMATCTTVLSLPTESGLMSLSADGSMMLLPFITDERACVRLYDVSGTSARLVHTFSSGERDLRGGSFAVIDGTEYALLYGNDGQNTYLDLYSLENHEKVEGKSVCLGFDVTASDFVPFGNGQVAFVINYQTHKNIAFVSLSDMSVTLVDNPSDLEIVSLSSGKADGQDVLCFSWYPSDAKATNLGRYGELSIRDGKILMRLSQADVLGSVRGPVRIDDKVVFSARFFEKGKLESSDIGTLGLSDAVEVGTSALFSTQRPDTSALSAVSTGYRPGRYFMDGVLIPLAAASFGDDYGLAGLGATWITTDPTETFSYSISAGFGSGNVIGSYTFAYDNDVVPFSVSVDAAYGTGLIVSEQSLPAGHVRLHTGVIASRTIELGHPYENLLFGDSFKYLMDFSPTGDFSGKVSNLVLAEYSHAFKTGQGPYQYYQYYVDVYSKNLFPGITAGFRVPSLLWWRCDGPHITNLPFSAAFDAHFVDSYDNILLIGQANVVLYGLEIQRAITFLGLHVQRFTLDASYIANYWLKTGTFLHQVQLCAFFSFTPVIGEVLTRTRWGLGATLTWNPQSGDCKVELYFSL